MIPMENKTAENDLVSVIMPSYNSAKFIRESIESVKRQTYSNWELLVTDDCSKDESAALVAAMAAQEPRIRLFSLKHNAGPAEARNHSLCHARGRYIAFLDSDDLWHAEKLEKQLSFMKQHHHAFTATDYNTIREDGTPLNRIVRIPSRLDYRHYLSNTIIGCLTVIVDRQQVGEFRMPDIRSSQDMALWLLIMRRGFEVYGLNEVLSTYRLVSNSNTAKKWKAAKNVWRVYRRCEHLSVCRSAYHFIGYAFHAALKRM